MASRRFSTSTSAELIPDVYPSCRCNSTIRALKSAICAGISDLRGFRIVAVCFDSRSVPGVVDLSNVGGMVDCVDDTGGGGADIKDERELSNGREAEDNVDEGERRAFA